MLGAADRTQRRSWRPLGAAARSGIIEAGKTARAAPGFPARKTLPICGQQPGRDGAGAPDPAPRSGAALIQ
jgi:hypothetical protein